MRIEADEAGDRLSELVERAAAGEDVTITRRGEPAAYLVPVRPQRRPRVLGQDAGRFTVPADFDAPLPDDVFA